jgi:hypothetical protein
MWNIRFYNFERPNLAFDYLAPAQVHGLNPADPFVIPSPLALSNLTTLS